MQKEKFNFNNCKRFDCSQSRDGAIISSWNNFTCQTYNVDNVVVPFFKRFLGLTKVVHLDLILINNKGLVQAIERALNFVHSMYFSWQFIDEQHSLTD